MNPLTTEQQIEQIIANYKKAVPGSELFRHVSEQLNEEEKKVDKQIVVYERMLERLLEEVPILNDAANASDNAINKDEWVEGSIETKQAIERAKEELVRYKAIKNVIKQNTRS